MDIGILMFCTDYSIDIAVLAKRAEELGYESLWVPEHAILPVEGESKWPGSPDGVIPKVYADIVDPFIALGRASAVTTDIKLATGICLVPEHNPLLLAKQVATLDMYSKGRFIFGIGAGWHAEETAIMGGDFAHRWTQTKESVLAMKQLWTTVGSEYHGNYYDFPKVYSFPRPVQKPYPPVLLGGHAKNVFKRTVDYGDGWMPNRTSPEEIAKGRATLDELCEAAGRDRLPITVYGIEADADLIKQFAEAGADRVVLRVDTADEATALKDIEMKAKSVLL